METTDNLLKLPNETGKSYNQLRELQLREMATVCQRKDGYDMILEIYSDDHGVLFDKENPAHVHVKDLNKNLLGKFAITKERPKHSDYIFDCYHKDGKLVIIPTEYKRKIVDWSADSSPVTGTNNWKIIIDTWRLFHSE